MTINRIRLSAGISLLEVMISMLILAFGILGLAPLMVHAISTNSTARDYSIATQLAKDRLEFYETAAALPPIPYTEVEDTLRGSYGRTTYITDNSVDTLIPADLVRVDVIVDWQDDAGLDRSTTMSTFLNRE